MFVNRATFPAQQRLNCSCFYFICFGLTGAKNFYKIIYKLANKQGEVIK